MAGRSKFVANFATSNSLVLIIGTTLAEVYQR
jgi:hypothetical protein